MKQLISIVVPAYNEEGNIEELHHRLADVFKTLPDYNFEVIIVENGSSDSTWEKLRSVCSKDSRFKAIQLSRNFTAPGGITAGFKYCRGDAAVVMCADLQDPPEMLPLFIQKWKEGYDVAYHVVSERRGVSWMRSVASEIFHWIMNKLTNNAFPRNGSVYRLMDKVAYQAFNDLNETNRYFPGLCNWIGFKSAGIEFPRAERFAGEAKSPFRVVFKIALNGIFAFSYVPLKLMTLFGTIISAGSFMYFLAMVIGILIEGKKTIPGLATQISLTLFMFGILFLSIGILGEYLARIYDEVKGRPNFIVRRTEGFEKAVDHCHTDTVGAPLLSGVYRQGAIWITDPVVDLSRSSVVTVSLNRE